MTPAAELRQLAELGQRMRRHQESYFKTKNRSDLHMAKRLEAQFDSHCNRILDTRPKLFAEPSA